MTNTLMKSAIERALELARKEERSLRGLLVHPSPAARTLFSTLVRPGEMRSLERAANKGKNRNT